MTLAPRCVLVERPTDYADVLARHGTREQARFFLAQRDIDLADVEERHLRYQETRTRVLGAFPSEWRIATLGRADLDRFLFAEDDIIVVLGQDGLVANVAKYLDGQPVIGLNPEPDRNPGVLVTQSPDAIGDLCADVVAGRASVQQRTMAAATLDDGQQVLALNEIFFGHRTHQSARYTLSINGQREHQSSSGLIAATGTGATGWAQSINHGRRDPIDLPGPVAPQLAWFVREAWDGPHTGTRLTAGLVDPGAAITVTCELGEDGVVFADGMEADRLRVDWGQRVTIAAADRRLQLVGD
ncbi:MAG: NAD(+)/NADH kinase [Solirubrobacteraceae bacterium]|nr:NAD(+)/NADH kinase [Solirubrobacteraceae bacterium]